MSEHSEKAEKKFLVSRVKEMGSREATCLEHGSFRVIVDDVGGFTPELCNVQENRHINAHWVPHFRSTSPRAYGAEENASWWKSEHLYHLAGSFPCAPSFGVGHIAAGVVMPVNGWTASGKWTYQKSGRDLETGAVWAVSAMDSPDGKMPLSFRKVDALLADEPVHYTALHIRNNGGKDVEISAGWQGFVGAPFFSPGCRITAAAKEWATPPSAASLTYRAGLRGARSLFRLRKRPLQRAAVLIFQSFRIP